MLQLTLETIQQLIADWEIKNEKKFDKKRLTFDEHNGSTFVKFLLTREEGFNLHFALKVQMKAVIIYFEKENEDKIERAWVSNEPLEGMTLDKFKEILNFYLSSCSVIAFIPTKIF